MDAEFDSLVRREAAAWLTVRTNDGLDPISSVELEDFTAAGRKFRLMDADRPYDDAIGPDGLLRYKWRGEDPDHAENRALGQR